MDCPVCQKNKAILDEYYGYLPCQACQNRESQLKKPGSIPEFTSEKIKEGRKQFADDIEQPHYKGHLNKRWLDIYGTKAAKRHGFSEKEIKHAKYTYNGLGKYYKEGN